MPIGHGIQSGISSVRLSEIKFVFWGGNWAIGRVYENSFECKCFVSLLREIERESWPNDILAYFLDNENFSLNFHCHWVAWAIYQVSIHNISQYLSIYECSVHMKCLTAVCFTWTLNYLNILHPALWSLSCTAMQWSVFVTWIYCVLIWAMDMIGACLTDTGIAIEHDPKRNLWPHTFSESPWLWLWLWVCSHFAVLSIHLCVLSAQRMSPRQGAACA